MLVLAALLWKRDGHPLAVWFTNLRISGRDGDNSFRTATTIRKQPLRVIALPLEDLSPAGGVQSWFRLGDQVGAITTRMVLGPALCIESPCIGMERLRTLQTHAPGPPGRGRNHFLLRRAQGADVHADRLHRCLLADLGEPDQGAQRTRPTGPRASAIPGARYIPPLIRSRPSSVRLPGRGLLLPQGPCGLSRKSLKNQITRFLGA